jgi:imidazolonepropionase-like amidohydrolase
MIRLSALPILGLLTLLLLAKDEVKSVDHPVVFKGARIHTAAGKPIDNGILVVQKGKIVAVGPADKVKVPDDAEVRDVAGKVIIPGLVDTHSHVGLYQIPARGEGDGNESSGPVQPGLRALDAISPADARLRMALAGGVTTANIMPGSGNVIGGQTVYVKFRGKTIEEMRVEGRVVGGLKMANGENPKRANFGRNKVAPATRMKIAALQREQFVKAREYQKKWDAHEQAKKDGKDVPEPERDINLDPLLEVLQKKRTVHFHCHRADDLMTAVRIAREFDFDIVLQHATEGYRVADELARLKVPVSLTLLDSPGGKMEAAGLLEENAAVLDKAGVKVAINTDDMVTESRFFLRTGAIAVRGGMSEDAALRALTLHGAQMMQLDQRVGSLEAGKDADLVVRPGSLETFHSHLGNAAALVKKGVPLALGTGFEGYVPRTRVVRQEAAMAMVNGLGFDAALRAVTLDAAKMLEIADRFGSVEAGKVADLVLLDGDPFEHSTHVTHTLLGGKVVYDREEYLKLPFSRRAMPLMGGGAGCCLGIW